MNKQQLFHAITPEEVLAAVDANTDGLTTGQVNERRRHYGENSLPEPPKKNALLRFLSHFHNVLIYVLLASALVTAMLGHAIDTGVILAVVLVNGLIGFINEI